MKIKKIRKYKFKNTIINTKKRKILKYFICIILIIIYLVDKYNSKLFQYFGVNPTINEKDENNPENYETHILDRIKDRLKGPQLMGINEYYFINGLIRKYKPRKLLEIGVCSGGMSAVILNAIKDREDAFLFSCDLETKHYLNSNFEVGIIVKNYFPELLNKWKLYTGNTTSAFIEEIGNDIDFVFIDTAHVMPGEVLNMLEIFPFLKKRAIIGFDDIDHQVRESLFTTNYFYPCNNLLFSVLRGKKIIMGQNKKDKFSFRKLGAVILEDNQEKYFYEYFYLLTNNWSYMPNKFEIDTIRKLIAKYYKPFFLSMFDAALNLNYKKLEKIGLLKKDYIQYTFKDIKRNKSSFRIIL